MGKTKIDGVPKENLCAVNEILQQIFQAREWDISFEQQERGLSISKNETRVKIRYHRISELFRGIGFLCQWTEEGKVSAEIQEEPVFCHLTYMVDCSRNAVCSVSYVKQLIRQLALMGYDRLMLYTEDTYEVPEYPFFGYLRGRYSQQELKELDSYGMAYGIELIPCIQTLAHMNGLFRWRVFDSVRDTGDILCCGQEETYELIEHMIQSFAETFHSRVINIGMDEAEMIGRGNFLKKFGYRERLDIMENHLRHVLEICKKYGYTCMMWSDMFFKMLKGDQYYKGNIEVTNEIRNKIPEGVELIYWDYYARDSKVYDSMMKQHKMLTDQVGFAGGAWKWTGFAPLLNHSMEASRLALERCREHGIQNVIVTGWGDDGGEASQSVVLPLLSLYAEFQYEQNMEDDWIAPRLLACTGAGLEEFLKLDSLNLTPDNPSPGRVSTAPAKYLLYQDVLLGIYDRHVDQKTYPAHFRECARQMQSIAEKGGDYAYLFETLGALARVLERKSDLGIRLKDAYDRKEEAVLEKLAEECLEISKDVEEFHQKLRVQWKKENKAFGMEIQDIRIGGLKERLNCASQRIWEYLRKETDQIEELEEERLLLDQRKNPGFDTMPLEDSHWAKIISASVL